MKKLQKGFLSVLHLGGVSLFADISYEGARAILGPFLFSLGAPPVAVGFISGMAEFFGYALRGIFGWLAQKVGRLWLWTAIGYSLTVIFVPMLALARSWHLAMTFIWLERFGKAVRTPSRDTLLSFASERMGMGKGFGLHEFLDQVGAVAGPLLVSLILSIGLGFPYAFALLLVPGLFALFFLHLARRSYPFEPEALTPPGGAIHLPPVFLPFLAFVGFSVLGFPHFALLSYHWKSEHLVSDPLIPIIFALAMAVDGIFSLFAGAIYDRYGWVSLGFIPVVALPISFMGFSLSSGLAIGGSVFWGLVLGAYITLFRASVARLTSPHSRSFSFGIFHTFFGITWMLGGTLQGWLYEDARTALILLCTAGQTLSLLTFFLFFLPRVKSLSGR